jgi:uncharacterized protein YecA (UPF0149 family)
MENNNVILDSQLKTGMIMDSASTSQTAQDVVESTIVNSPNVDLSKLMPRKPKQVVREYKIGRNETCPCGSGKKYKHCCLSTGEYEKLVVKK